MLKCAVNVSTHSRAEAAAHPVLEPTSEWSVSTHSRAEAAASRSKNLRYFEFFVSTHSRAEAAAGINVAPCTF